MQPMRAPCGLSRQGHATRRERQEQAQEKKSCPHAREDELPSRKRDELPSPVHRHSLHLRLQLQPHVGGGG